MTSKSPKASILLIIFSFLLLTVSSVLAYGDIDQSQDAILKNIQLYLNKTLFTGNENKEERQGKEAFTHQFDGGYCGGLSSLWLYTKWLQTQPNTSGGELIVPPIEWLQIQPNTTGKRDDYDRFKSSVELIVTWDGKRELTREETAEFARFILLIEYFQDPNKYQNKVSQGRLDQLLQDTSGRRLKKEYSIALPLKREVLKVFLNTPNIIQDGKLIYIVSYKHVTALFKHKGEYYFYDPNYHLGELATISIDVVAERIYIAHRGTAIGFAMYSFDDTVPAPYPNQREVLQDIYQSLNERTCGYQEFGVALKVDCQECVKLLLADPRVDPNVKDNNGWTPFMRAVLENNLDLEIMKLLLADQRVDPNIKDNEGFTLLEFAIYTGNPEIMRLLLADPRVDPNAKDNDGWTPLKFAIDVGDPEIVKLLLANPRVDLNVKDKYGRTPLIYAIYRDKPEIVKLLLAYSRLDSSDKEL